ncbi:putative secreted Zn-dependent protease [Agrobacterium sp. DSM 25558]|nr:putative secreted Zn-dependent protease [Agrobacterium sp. DSM 25558]
MPRFLTTILVTGTLLALLAQTANAQTGGWTPSEQIKTYAISGNTGFGLYQSIGERGPQAGVQAVAHTTFKLTWRRDYRPQPDGACVLATARPNLTIIYTWPKAPAKLPPDVAASWQSFISGVEKHERVHGQHILDMVKKIEAYSVGLRAEDDPKCQKVRTVLQQRLGELSNEQRQRGRDFDRDELSNGGAVHQLILALVNGP